MNRRWIVSPAYDIALFLGPALAAASAVIVFPSLRFLEPPIWAWLIVSVLIDGSHTWAIVYRTYLDREEWRRRRTLLICVPVLYAAAAIPLHSARRMYFWHAFAYLTLFHLVRQQYGFMRYYQHFEEPGSSDWDRRLDGWMVYAVMLFPVIFWHAGASRPLRLIVSGDLFPLPAIWLPAAGAAAAAISAVYVVRQVQRYRAGVGSNVGKLMLIASTAVTWNVGLILIRNGFVWTMATTFAHSIPYLGLIWYYGSRRWISDDSWRGELFRPRLASVSAYLLLLMALAYLGEGFRDGFVQEHSAAFFHLTERWRVPDIVFRILFPLATIPQATHFILDAFIWKTGRSNPSLKRYLFEQELRPAA